MEADPIIDWELTTASNAINIVVVGRVGNGKSATGNSILGWEAFFSDDSLSAVTCSSELKGTILNDGRIVNVIDTPGLFDFSTSAEVISEEILKCINLAKDGIHAVLMVYSLRSRFSIEEVVAIEGMKSLFGDNIVDYMILVFTNGDFLESKKKSLNDLISLSPEPLRVEENVKLSMEMTWKQQVEERVARLEAEERVARLEAERLGQKSLKDEEIRKLKEDLNEIRKQYEELRKRKAKGKICAIL